MATLKEGAKPLAGLHLNLFSFRSLEKLYQNKVISRFVQALNCHISLIKRLPWKTIKHYNNKKEDDIISIQVSFSVLIFPIICALCVHFVFKKQEFNTNIVVIYIGVETRRSNKLWLALWCICINHGLQCPSVNILL